MVDNIDLKVKIVLKQKNMYYQSQTPPPLGLLLSRVVAEVKKNHCSSSLIAIHVQTRSSSIPFQSNQT